MMNSLPCNLQIKIIAVHVQIYITCVNNHVHNHTCIILHTITYILRLRMGIPNACKGLAISGPKQLFKKPTNLGNKVFDQ